jgi:aminopeptidase N
MQDYYRTYNGKNASTEDFLAIVSKHAGIDMKWFFDQWVYSTPLPKYEYSYRSKDTAGQYKVTLRVKQLNVPDTFRAIIPLKIEFGQTKFYRLRVIVSGPVTQLDLPLFPYEPTNIIFNDLEGVLCEAEKVGW